MGSYVHLKFELGEKTDISTGYLQDFVENISEKGWSYESERFKTGYMADDDWIYEAPLSEAIEAISQADGGSLKVWKDGIEVLVEFSPGKIVLSVDYVNFRDSERLNIDGDRTSKEVIELSKALCRYLELDRMAGGYEYFVGDESERVDEDKSYWLQYGTVSVPEDTFEEKDIDGGTFVAFSLRPL